MLKNRGLQGLRSLQGLKGLLFCILFLFPVLLFAKEGINVEVDTDQDGLSDEREAYYYTDPNNPDTDGDGYLDGEEVETGYSPHLGNRKRFHENDYDDDGLNDWAENWFKSDLGNGDTDGDGFGDYEEVMSGYSPVSQSTSTRYIRWIEVDREKQRVNYYVANLKIHNWPASTGNPGSETPEGKFKIEAKIPEKRYVGPDYDLPGVTWNMLFLPMYYIHAAYWHNDFGIKTHSHGCVNMREKDAAVLYKYADIGVPVYIIGETPKRYWVGT